MDQFIKEYQINVDGLQNGLPIPSGFLIAMESFRMYGIEAVTDIPEPTLPSYGILYQLHTYATLEHTNQLVNDAIIGNKYRIDLEIETMPEVTDVLIYGTVLIFLEGIYGEGNVVEL